MTPLEIIQAARDFTNNQSTEFFSDDELINYLNFALKQASHRAKILENVSTSATTPATSTSGTADYVLDSTVLEIKRVEYAGLKLRPSTFVEMDKLDSAIQNQPTQGTPRFYVYWGDTLTLFPTPNNTGDEIKVFSIDEHSTITSGGTVSGPSQFHHYYIDYIVYRMYLKEKHHELAAPHLQIWENHLNVMARQMHAKKRRDHFNIVQSEDQSISTILGFN